MWPKEKSIKLSFSAFSLFTDCAEGGMEVGEGEDGIISPSHSYNTQTNKKDTV